MPSTNDTSSTSGINETPAGAPPTPAPLFFRLLREPLLHFLILGAALFVGYSLVSSEEPETDDASIVVSAGKIEHLAALFTRTWQRPPTRSELDSLIDDFVREEAAYREGTAIGLDRNDTVIRRRIRQKLDFVAEEFVSQVQPTDQQLQDYLSEHAEEFRISPRVTFQHVYFDPARHGDELTANATQLLESLRSDQSLDAATLGDRTLLEFRYEDVSKREVASLFGEQFAAELLECEPGNWLGPIGSAYGVHLVRVDAIQQGEVPDLESARVAVQREWEHDRRQELVEEYYQGLLKKYEVVIESAGLDGEAE